MGDPVNLRQARKQRERVKNRAQAAGNAAKFGITKAERKLETARAEKARATLDAHRREPE